MSARVVSGVAALVFAIVTAMVGVGQGAPLRFLLLDAILGLSFLVAGMLAWRRRPDVRTGPALTLCVGLWFLGSYGPAGIEGLSSLGFSFELRPAHLRPDRLFSVPVEPIRRLAQRRTVAVGRSGDRHGHRGGIHVDRRAGDPALA
ncbi:MAG: hypothetical protein H0X18_00480 [Geodermatophilaceae bacterium]|nr:hypothetical protein [Geodermatophilaceae bacterium]